MLWVLGPAAASLGLGTLPESGVTWRAVLLVGAGLSALPAGAWMEARPGLARACAALGLVGGAVAMGHVLLADPAAVVGAGVLCATLALYIFQDPLADPDIQGNVPGPDHSARVGLVLAAATCFAVVVEQHALPALVGAGVASGAAALLAVRWGWRGGAPVWSRVVVVALVCIGPATAATLVREPTATASLLGGTQLLASLLVRGVDLDDGLGSETSIFTHPARILVVTFAALCAVGAVALAVPASSESGTSVGFLDAAFTSVSAVCVTGLIVLDTPNAYGPFGEGVIAVLIQVGGLGIMTFYTVALAALGRRLSLRHERALAGALNVDERDRLVGSVRRILLVTGVTEALGALVLFWRFNAWTSACATSSACVAGSTCIEGACAEPVWQSLWRAVFTSISAFCNAGFALQSDSLVPYQNDPFVVHTVGALIVLGGLSPVAVVALPRWLRGRRVDVQVALILWTSLALLVVGAVAYGLMEWTVSLGHLSWVDRVHNAWFQSVTLRTAGFNTVDLAAARPSTQAMMIVLMFVGGSPGGTAGGVKTTTAVVLLLTVIATLRGHEDATAFGRRIARGTVYKAAAVVTVGVLMAFGALVVIELTQTMDPEVAVFEVVSALATVGLSIGGTGALDDVGKVIVILCMFAGRVGPLTLFLFLAERRASREAIAYPEAEVDVG